MFFTILSKGDKFCDATFAALDNQTHLKRDLLLKERISPRRANAFES